MKQHVGTAVVGPNKAITFGQIKPLNKTGDFNELRRHIRVERWRLARCIVPTQGWIIVCQNAGPHTRLRAGDDHAGTATHPPLKGSASRK